MPKGSPKKYVPTKHRGGSRKASTTKNVPTKHRSGRRRKR